MPETSASLGDPDDDAEICQTCDDVNGGETVEEYSREFRDLKEEATSLRHLMCHLPKNKYCRACQAGKLQPQRSGRKDRGLGPVPLAFGDEAIADHIIARSARSQSVTGDHDALLIYDRATKWVDCYPVRTQSASDAAYRSLAFKGPKIRDKLLSY